MENFYYILFAVTGNVLSYYYILFKLLELMGASRATTTSPVTQNPLTLTSTQLHLEEGVR